MLSEDGCSLFLRREVMLIATYEGVFTLIIMLTGVTVLVIDIIRFITEIQTKRKK